MQLDDLINYAKENRRFNDIWFYGQDPERGRLETEPVRTLIGGDVPGLQSFAAHGSGSLFALWNGHVAWLDSEGEQCVIAKDIDDFVDALHLYTGSLYQLASDCQETDRFVQNNRGGKHRTAEQLKDMYKQSWFDDAVWQLHKDYPDGVGPFVAWATSKGRREPTDLIDRLIALRPLTAVLRAACEAVEAPFVGDPKPTAKKVAKKPAKKKPVKKAAAKKASAKKRPAKAKSAMKPAKKKRR